MTTELLEFSLKSLLCLFSHKKGDNHWLINYFSLLKSTYFVKFGLSWSWIWLQNCARNCIVRQCFWDFQSHWIPKGLLRFDFFCWCILAPIFMIGFNEMRAYRICSWSISNTSAIWDNPCPSVCPSACPVLVFFK